jgi:hypothetical protein
MTIVITNCTNRKIGTVLPGLTTDYLAHGSIDYVARQWLVKLKSATAKKPAREIYCGRSFREAEASAFTLKCPLYVVSAGLGIINADHSVPIYNLTIAPGTNDSILNKVRGNTSAKAWWSKIARHNPFGSSLISILEDHPDDLILLALSRSYIDLLQDELLNCSLDQQSRMRFFGKQLDSILPNSLSENWMPYDDRLDSAGPGYSGTQSDFSQRALRHFVTKVLNRHEDGDLFTHRTMVLGSLSTLVKRETPKRRRLSDDEIGKVIRDNWGRGKGRTTTLLRIVRRELDIACEQSRFKNIYHSIKGLMGDENE